GTWSVEFESTQRPKTDHGVVRYQWIANDKFLRAYASFDDGRESLTIFRYDPDTKGLRKWIFDSGPTIFISDPAEGAFDVDNQKPCDAGRMARPEGPVAIDVGSRANPWRAIYRDQRADAAGQSQGLRDRRL